MVHVDGYCPDTLQSNKVSIGNGGRVCIIMKLRN